MKSLLSTSVFLLIMGFWMASCDKKSSGGGSTPTPEADLVVALSPDPGSTTTPVQATGTTYQFNVVIQSTMPPQGVDVKVEYKRDSDNGVIFSQNYTSTTTPISVTITAIPFNQVGTVTVTVTSKSKATNTATKTFKLVRK